ncbi:VOC family protein [Marinoscillum sp.]|uniref:VOC family protein n=1 Tax=Marinoscillum sp. TaxID=2024838 RepID=UPI003BAD9BFD
MNPVVHFELPYKNADRAKNFYTNVFGWKLHQYGSEMNHYITCTTAEKDVKPGAPAGSIDGGLYPIQPGSAEHPAFVIGVENIDTASDLIVTHGGQLLSEAHEIPGIGTYRQFSDSEGNKLSLLKPNASSHD